MDSGGVKCVKEIVVKSMACRKLYVASCRNSIQKVRRRTYLAKGLKTSPGPGKNACRMQKI